MIINREKNNTLLNKKKTFDENKVKVIEVRNLTKKFKIGTFGKTKEIHAVNNVSFKIGEEKVLGLVGETGSGKSTIGRILVKLYAPTDGEIFFNGSKVPSKMKGRSLLNYRKKVQMIFQDPFSSLNPNHTIGYHLMRPLKIHNICEKNMAKELSMKILENFGLLPAEEIFTKYPHELSGGQRQRVGIARAVTVSPQLIVADEPTSMLDVSIRLEMMNLLLDLKEKQHISFLFITHDLAAAHYISDQIAVIYAGYIMERGPSDKIINDPKHPYTKLLIKAAPKPEKGLIPTQIDVEGEVPDLTNLPKGCPFAPRCPSAMSKCEKEIPEMLDVENDYSLRCFLYR